MAGSHVASTCWPASFEKPADGKFSNVTLFSLENDGGKRSSVNVFRHVFLLWLAVDLMRIDGEGAENEMRGGSAEKFSEFRVAAANLPNYFEFNFPYRDFQRLTIGGEVLFVLSRREQAWLSITAWFISEDVSRIYPLAAINSERFSADPTFKS